jgi:hypothetical protein
MKGNESNFAFICFHEFFRIGTFQRVTQEKEKNFPPAPRNPLRLQTAAKYAPQVLVGPSGALSATEFVITGDFSHNFGFAQENVAELWNYLSPAARFERRYWLAMNRSPPKFAC